MKRRRTTLQDYNLVDIRHEKLSLFGKFEIILPLPCFLLGSLTNQHCGTWTSMINLWIDSRTSQKLIILSTRPRFNYNYLELFKESVSRNMMLSHYIDHALLECSSWYDSTKFLNQLLKQLSCPRNICTEHWSKLPAYLESFLGHLLIP